MRPSTDIVFSLLGDPTGSSRALRQIRALDEAGLSIEVIGFGERRLPDALPERVGFTELALPPGGGPRFFLAAHHALNRHLRGRSARLFLASDLYTLPASAAAARRNSARLIFDSRELYSALDSSAGRPLVSRGWGALERRYIHRADAVLTVSEGIADVMARRYRIPRPTVLPNVTATGEPVERTNALRELLHVEDDAKMLVLYQGLFREGRGLPYLLDAVRTMEHVRVVLIGEGALQADLARTAATLDDRVHIHPFVPPDALVPLTASADLGACLGEALTESLRLGLPNKLFEYLSAGTPVLASPSPEIRRVVEQFEVGTIADPTSSSSIRQALHIASDPQLRQRWMRNTTAANDRYSWPAHAAPFVQLIQNLISASRSPT